MWNFPETTLDASITQTGNGTSTIVSGVSSTHPITVLETTVSVKGTTNIITLSCGNNRVGGEIINAGTAQVQNHSDTCYDNLLLNVSGGASGDIADVDVLYVPQAISVGNGLPSPSSQVQTNLFYGFVLFFFVVSLIVGFFLKRFNSR